MTVGNCSQQRAGACTQKLPHVWLQAGPEQNHQLYGLSTGMSEGVNCFCHHMNTNILQAISLFLARACVPCLVWKEPVWKCQTVKRLKGKPADVNVDGGNVISSTLFVCAVHFLSRELFVIFSPTLVSLYKFIFWFCCPVHSVTIVCLLETPTKQPT